MFIFPVWIITYPVVLFVCAHSSPFMCTIYTGGDLGGFLNVIIVATCLAIRLCHFSHLDLVISICTGETLHMIPSYGCGSGGITSVLSGMT